MAETILSWVALGSVVLGLALLLLSPVVERAYGASLVSMAIISAFILELVAVAGGVAAALPDRGTFAESLGYLSAVGASIILVWSLVVYLEFRFRRVTIPPDRPSTVNCDSKLIQGEYTTFSLHRKTWRSDMNALFRCSPSDGALSERCWANGGAYYGLWLTSGEADVTPDVTIYCRSVGGKCVASASEVGLIEDINGPVRVYVKNVITPSGDTVEVTAKMGAALNASGGPSITVTAGPVGVDMSFPDASLSLVSAMGTYIWQCIQATEGTSAASVSAEETPN